MRPGPQQRVAAYPQPAWASSTWKLAARVESLSSAGAACTIITKQISTLTAGTSAAHPRRRCDGCTGRRGRQGPHPRARRIEVTRARDPLLGPRRTSSPPTLTPHLECFAKATAPGRQGVIYADTLMIGVVVFVFDSAIV